MQKESNFNNSLTGTDQFTRALIDQTITHTTSIQQLEERVSKLPDPTAALTALEQRVQKLEDLQTKTIAAIDESTETLKIIADRLLLPATLINQLSRQLQQHGKLFEKPLEKSVHYTHFVGRSVLVCTLLGLVILVLGFFYGRLRITANELEGNDIKWRHVKLSPMARSTNCSPKPTLPTAPIQIDSKQQLLQKKSEDVSSLTRHFSCSRHEKKWMN